MKTKFLKWFGNMRCTHSSACRPPPRCEPTMKAAVGASGSSFGGFTTLPKGCSSKTASNFLMRRLVSS